MILTLAIQDCHQCYLGWFVFLPDRLWHFTKPDTGVLVAQLIKSKLIIAYACRGEKASLGGNRQIIRRTESCGVVRFGGLPIGHGFYRLVEDLKH